MYVKGRNTLKSKRVKREAEESRKRSNKYDDEEMHEFNRNRHNKAMNKT